MDTNEKYEYWLDIAQYDLETAEAMLSGKRWLYVVFMCQQAIEKFVKGLYTLYLDDNIPKIHNIPTLVERFEDKLTAPVSKDMYDLFELLSSYYLNNRYPDFLNKLSGQVGEIEAKEVLSRTK
jgi:HEPN domain-containing protein